MGPLYLAGFAQAWAPHVGPIIPASENLGILVHIRIDRDVSPNWHIQARVRKIVGDTSLCAFLSMHEKDGITPEILQDAATIVVVPTNDTLGERLPWAIMSAAQKLHESGRLQVESMSKLANEFNEFSAGNKEHARRDRFSLQGRTRRKSYLMKNA